MSDTVLGEGKYLRLLKRGRWEFAARTGDGRAVAIVAVTEAGDLLLVEQHRPPINGPAIELPAGIVGDKEEFEGEDMSVAAERELLEETGYAAEQLEFLTEGPPSPGAMSETIAFFLATGLRKVADGGGDETEDITVHEVPVHDVPQFLRTMADRGVAVDSKVWAGLFFVGASSSPQAKIPIEIPSSSEPSRVHSPTGLAIRDELLERLDAELPALPDSRRVGILGGTFNPPHVGHALLAHAMLATEQIDELWVVPVFEHPFGKSSADFDSRVAMCRLAFAKLGGAVRVVEIERELPKPSYTVQTLSTLHAVRPGIKLTLVIGSDIVPELPRWRDPERLPRLSRLIVVPRQGAPPIEPSEDLDIKIYRGFRLPKVSSTAIKKALGSGKSVDGWLDLAVLRYIAAHGLYK
jgi:ADP-ribose pyrophosphatase